MTECKAQQVVITGYDQVSSLGRSLAEFDSALWSGHADAEAYNIELPGLDPACVPICRSSIDISKLIAPSKVPMDRGTALALLVAMQASTSASLDSTIDRDG